MVACSDGAALHCFVSAVTAKSCQLKKTGIPQPALFPPQSGNVNHLGAASGHRADPESFHKQIRSKMNKKCF